MNGQMVVIQNYCMNEIGIAQSKDNKYNMTNQQTWGVQKHGVYLLTKLSKPCNFVHQS